MTALRDKLADRFLAFLGDDESPTDTDKAWSDGLAGLALTVIAAHELGEGLTTRIAETLVAAASDLAMTPGAPDAAYEAAARRLMEEVVAPALAARDRSFDAALRHTRIDRDTAIARAQQLERDRDITVRERDEAVTRAELAEVAEGRLRERLETAEQPAAGGA